MGNLIYDEFGTELLKGNINLKKLVPTCDLVDFNYTDRNVTYKHTTVDNERTLDSCVRIMLVNSGYIADEMNNYDNVTNYEILNLDDFYNTNKAEYTTKNIGDSEEATPVIFPNLPTIKNYSRKALPLYVRDASNNMVSNTPYDTNNCINDTYKTTNEIITPTLNLYVRGDVTNTNSNYFEAALRSHPVTWKDSTITAKGAVIFYENWCLEYNNGNDVNYEIIDFNDFYSILKEDNPLPNGIADLESYKNAIKLKRTLIAYLDFGADYSSTEGDFTVNFDSNGIITLNF